MYSRLLCFSLSGTEVFFFPAGANFQLPRDRTYRIPRCSERLAFPIYLTKYKFRCAVAWTLNMYLSALRSWIVRRTESSLMNPAMSDKSFLLTAMHKYLLGCIKHCWKLALTIMTDFLCWIWMHILFIKNTYPLRQWLLEYCYACFFQFQKLHINIYIYI